MHATAFAYAVKALLKAGVGDAKILEIGSADINATAQGMSLRTLLDGVAQSYYGIDRQDGPGVDRKVAAKSYQGRGRFDIVISTEALEHTERPEDILECAWRALRPGGVLILTAAGEGRQPHGADGGAVGEGEWYQNIARVDLETWLAEWADVEITEDREAKDIYATARKPESGQHMGDAQDDDEDSDADEDKAEPAAAQDEKRSGEKHE